jgi:hypothetical protein
MIRKDSGASEPKYVPLFDQTTLLEPTVSGGIVNIDTSGPSVTLYRNEQSVFKGNDNFDQTSYNRGWVTVWYV